MNYAYGDTYVSIIVYISLSCLFFFSLVLGFLTLFDISDFQISGISENSKQSFTKSSKRRYFGAQIPLGWLSRACALTHKALATALAIWDTDKLTGKTGTVTLTSKGLKPYHVDRQAKARALKELEGAGLIKVTRQNRKNPSVTILVNS